MLQATPVGNVQSKSCYTVQELLEWGVEDENEDNDRADLFHLMHVNGGGNADSEKACKVGMLVTLCAGSALSVLQSTDASFSIIPPLPGKVGNYHRDREQSILTVRSWDDDMFRRQFRLHRSDFNHLLSTIAPSIAPNVTKAINSSGSSVSPELRLLVTLRILAGASYLDMIWYNISVNHCMDLVTHTCEAINGRIDNISFPSWNDEVGYRQLAAGWQQRMHRKFGALDSGLMNGIVSAGDGIAIQIREPTTKDLNGKAAATYMNRKGFFALVVQAFCDSHCRFQTFDVSWPGSTGDCTAFGESALYIALKQGMAPAWAHFALDEAYSSYGGGFLTPFSKSQLLRARTENFALYQQMRAFNHVLSSLRIHIERAFGQLVRRFGILWKPLEMRLAAATTIVLCCARLHNLCVSSWMRDHDHSSDGYDSSIPAHEHVGHIQDDLDDEQVAQALTNDEDGDRPRAAHSAQRYEEMLKIYAAGIVINDQE